MGVVVSDGIRAWVGRVDIIAIPHHDSYILGCSGYSDMSIILDDNQENPEEEETDEIGAPPAAMMWGDFCQSLEATLRENT